MATSSLVQAQVSSWCARRETFFRGVVRWNGKRVYRIDEQMSEQAVQSAIADWAREMGKSVQWQYDDNKPRNSRNLKL